MEQKTSLGWRVENLYRDDQAGARSRIASERLLDVAAGVPEDSRVSLVLAGDGTGRVTIRLLANQPAEPELSLDWIGDGVARWVQEPDAALSDPSEMGVLFEVLPAVRVKLPDLLDIDDPLAEPPTPLPDLWPVPFLHDGMELLTALTTVEAQVRVHLSPANDLERQMLAQHTRRWASTRDPLEYSQYMGSPVRARCFVGQHGNHISPRLRAALGKLGAGLVLVPRDLTRRGTLQAWDGEPSSLAGAVQPHGVAMCFVHLPAAGEQPEVCGIPTAEAETKPVPLDGDQVEGGLRLGRAVLSTGQTREVRLGVQDLLLHTQVLGASGTGKSTLLASMVKRASELGIGVTVIDPHSHLVSRILAECDEQMIGRTVVVRSGDVANPVPVNPLNSTDTEMVSEVLVQVLREVHDPGNQGFMGPRFERVYSQSMRALRLLLGERANLSAVPLLLRDRASVEHFSHALQSLDPDLAKEFRTELAGLSENDSAEVTAWINAKFQRMRDTPELRAIMGTGLDAVDVTEVMDQRKLLLIDLAKPTIGDMGAPLLGEMWLVKHWAALSQRQDTSQPHLLIVDEAPMFASGLLPRLLSEARKFGLGVVLAHQHLEQLTADLREAALANTSNVIVFRSGPREAATSALRLGSWAGGPLTRLPVLQAAATLSQGRNQTDAFSLIVDYNDECLAAPHTPEVEAAIMADSNGRFVDPYRGTGVLTGKDVDRAVEKLLGTAPAQPERPSTGSDFLGEWMAERARRRAAGQHQPSAGPSDQDDQTDPTDVPFGE